MLELLIVVTIIAMLVGLSAPSLTQAMHSGKEAVSVQKLRQLHLALSMYRADQESSQDYGTIGEVGVPDWPLWQTALKPYGVNDDLWKSPCYLHREDNDLFPTIVYTGHTDQQFQIETTEHEGNFVIFRDMNCTLPKFSLNNQFHPKRGIGVTLNGRVIKKTAPDRFELARWWQP